MNIRNATNWSNFLCFFKLHRINLEFQGLIATKMSQDIEKMPLIIYPFQARNVGVGGYLLGVGVNPIGTTHRHGFGADHVLQYKMVLADGSIAVVNDFNTTLIERYGKRSVINLFFLLRISNSII